MASERESGERVSALQFERSVAEVDPGPGPSVGQQWAAVQARRGQAMDVIQALGETGGDVHQTAAHGVSGGGGELPHLGAIQASFGRHDVSGVSAHTGGRAAEANAAMGSKAYATGNAVAFSGGPDLHTAAHEAAHVVQQRKGVQLKGGVGQVGDPYERHADAVADAVVQGRSAEGLLDQGPGGGGGAGVQHAVQFEGPGQTPGQQGPGQQGSGQQGPAPAATAGGDLSGKRNAAKLAMEEWKVEQLKLLNRQKDFEDQNWTWYLGRTSLNPYLTMNEAWYLGLAAGALTTVLGVLVPSTAIGAKIGALVGAPAGPLGTAVGAVVGFVLGAIAGIIVGILTHSPDSAAADAAKQASGQIGDQIAASSSRRDSQFGKVEGELNKQKKVVDAETDSAKLDRTKANFEAEKGVATRAAAAVNPADRTMAQEMLARWTLQHAGDEEDQDKSTSEAQWDAAADGTGLRTKGNIRRPDLFIHQTEAHLSRTGLRANFFGSTIEQMKAAVGGSSGPGGQGVDKTPSFKMTASQALAKYEKRSVWVTGAVADAGKFESWYLEAYRKSTGQSWVSHSERRDIRGNKVKVECFLDLTTADGACYVNEWEYRLVFPSIEAMGFLYDGDHSFDISPD